MMKLSCVLVLCLVAGASAAGDYGLASKGGKWNYGPAGPSGGSNPIGPNKWYEAYPKCDQKKQSPINILTSGVEENKKGVGKLTMGPGWDTPYKIQVTNIKKSVEFVPVVPDGEKFPTVTYKDTTYRLAQFHAHWGKTNSDGSEHAVDWQKYAAEIHFVHYNTKYKDLSAAAAEDDGLLVWGHFLKVNSKNQNEDPQMNSVLNSLSSVIPGGQKVTTTSKYSLGSLLPTSNPGFYQIYTYEGSLTTPPCYESVRWILNRTPILVSETQMSWFRKLKDSAMGSAAKNVDNYRPIQSLWSRKVSRNFGDDEVCSSSVPVKPMYAIVVTLLAMLFLRH